MDIGKLENDALNKAVVLIDDIIYEVRKLPLYVDDHVMIERIREAWDLLQTFGDLGDNDGMFSEFVSIYNTDRGYDE